MDNGKFLSASIASRCVISELATSEKDDPSTLFLTIAANQMNHPGLGHVCEFINNKSAEWFAENHGKHCMDITLTDEYVNALDTGLSSVLLRNWLLFCDPLVEQLENTTAHTFGRVIKFFVRCEYQDGEENLCHLHIVLRTEEALSLSEKCLISFWKDF
jgi:hypothetical protein